MKPYITTIKQGDDGDLYVEIPAEIVAEHELEEGDAVDFEARAGEIILTFPEKG